jgi:hypothetical protein
MILIRPGCNIGVLGGFPHSVRQYLVKGKTWKYEVVGA